MNNLNDSSNTSNTSNTSNDSSNQDIKKILEGPMIWGEIPMIPIFGSRLLDKMLKDITKRKDNPKQK